MADVSTPPSAGPGAEPQPPAAAPAPTGRDVLAAIADGRLPPPPAATLLALDLVEVGDGATVFGFDARPEIGNPVSAHGGILAAIVDFAVATAVWSQQPAGMQVVTADLHVSFLRPIALDGARYTCAGRVIHAGRSQVNAVAEIRSRDGELHVQAMATCRVMAPDHANSSGARRADVDLVA